MDNRISGTHLGEVGDILQPLGQLRSALWEIACPTVKRRATIQIFLSVAAPRNREPAAFTIDLVQREPDDDARPRRIDRTRPEERVVDVKSAALLPATQNEQADAQYDELARRRQLCGSRAQRRVGR